MTTNVVDIVMAIDADYADPAKSTVRSLLDCTSSAVRLHVIDGGIGKAGFRAFSASFDDQVEMAYYVPSCEIALDLVPAYNDYLSPACMARLHVGEVLPRDLNRVMYVDADLLFLEDPAPLWDIDLCGHCVGAVLDGGWPKRLTSVDVDGEFHEQYTGAASPGYFNSGVMLIDLDSWRSQRVYQRCMSLHESVRGVMRAPDQDLLNMVLASAWHPLPAKWNRIIMELADPDRHLTGAQRWKEFVASQSFGPEAEEWYAYLASGHGIVHYSGRIKPWQMKFPDGPLKQLYARYSSVESGSH